MNLKPYMSACLPYLLTLPTLGWALPFEITPKAGTSLPTKLTLGQPVNAYYTVRNKTSSVRTGNYLKYLPMNVEQVTSNSDIPDLCGATFSLQPNHSSGDSCTLQLLVSGTVNGNDPDPKHHLFACFPHGITCAGTSSPLNVSDSVLVAGGYFLDDNLNQFIGLSTSTNNGLSWSSTQALMPPPGYQSGLINSISSSDQLTVGVGNYQIDSDLYSTIATSANQGKTWSQQILPYLASHNYSALRGVTCLGSKCLAAGFSGNTNLLAIEALIATSNDSGLTWSQQALPELTNVSITGATGISCVDTTCVTIGFVQTNDGYDQSWVAASADGGSSWSQLVLPLLSGINFQQLLGVSCTLSSCIAVGNYSNTSGISHPGIAISTDNGSTWTQSILPILPPFQQSYYNGSIPWLRTQEVDWVDIYDTSIKITEEGLKNSSAQLIPANWANLLPQSH